MTNPNKNAKLFGSLTTYPNGRKTLEKNTFEVYVGLKKIAKIMRETTDLLLLLVAGGSCSGKGYVCERLDRICQDPFAYLCLDKFWLDNDDPKMPKNSQGYGMFDDPKSYSLREIIRSVNGLCQGESVWVPEYDIWHNRRVRYYGNLVEPRKNICAEGLYAINFLHELPFKTTQDFVRSGPKTRVKTLKVFVEASEKTRLERKIKRDREMFGVTKKEVEDYFFTLVKEAHDTKIEPQRMLADMILIND